MDLAAHLESLRTRYVDGYRRVIAEQREQFPGSRAEVWVTPEASTPGKRPERLCADLLVETPDGAQIALVMRDEAPGKFLGEAAIGTVPVKIYEAIWENMSVWVRCESPDWSAMLPWISKWRVEKQPEPDDEHGLAGIVHHITPRIREGGGHLFLIDFGSAPVEAFTELLQLFATMGATHIEIGRSDGSDLPPEVLTTLRKPEISVDELADMLIRLISQSSDFTRAVRTQADLLEIYPAGAKDPILAYIGNIHRMLHRIAVESRPMEVNRWLRGQRDTRNADEPDDLSQLSLVIKDDQFISHVSGMGKEVKRRPLARRFVADLWIACVWDGLHGMKYTMDDEPEKYGMTADEMMARARENFLERRPPVELTQHGPLHVARTGDCYDASLLLDDRWWSESAPKTNGELLACIPSRDLVLIGDASNAETVPAMLELAQKIEESRDHLISNTILIRRDNQWHPHKVTPPAPPLTITPPTPVTPPAKPPAKKPWWKFW